MTNLLFFSSPIGLGHVTRDIALAQCHEFDVKFVTGEIGKKLFSSYGFQSINRYSPPNFYVNNGILKKSLRWLVRYYFYYRRCKEIASRAISMERPQTIISDEDFASLAIAHQKKLQSILITDILESNFTRGFGSVVEKKMNQSMKKIIKKCDAVIIPEEGINQENVFYVGPIVRKTAYSREDLRKKFSFRKKTIVISTGGTNVGRFLIEKSVQSIKRLNLDVDSFVVSGPSMQISNLPIKNLGFVYNLHEIIFASDLIISIGGKSTIDEATNYGTPGIFIPIKGHFEQEKNAKKEGFSYEDIFRLDSLIPQKLNEKRKAKNFQGELLAASIIKKLVS